MVMQPTPQISVLEGCRAQSALQVVLRLHQCAAGLWRWRMRWMWSGQ
jgi:hypothetical protein